MPSERGPSAESKITTDLLISWDPKRPRTGPSARGAPPRAPSDRRLCCRIMHSTVTCLLLALAGASGLQLAAAPSSLHRPQLARHGAPRMQESPEPPPSQQLSDETLRKAAETASEPSGPAWPTPEARHTLEPRSRAALECRGVLASPARLCCYLPRLTRVSRAVRSPSVRPSIKAGVRAAASSRRRATASTRASSST